MSLSIREYFLVVLDFHVKGKRVFDLGPHGILFDLCWGHFVYFSWGDLLCYVDLFLLSFLSLEF